MLERRITEGKRQFVCRESAPECREERGVERERGSGGQVPRGKEAEEEDQRRLEWRADDVRSSSEVGLSSNLTNLRRL